MYAEFAKVAKEEGFDYIAMLFEEVGKIEKEHEERYNALVANIENDRVFKREEKQVWICGNCGHIVIAEKLRKFVLFATIRKHILNCAK